MPKIVNHMKYKEELLERCIPVFKDQGFHELNMRTLSSELQVSTGTLYHYFSSKENLFESLFIYLGKKTAIEITHELCNTGSQGEMLNRLFDHFENECERSQVQFLLSADLIRNNISENSEAIRQHWAEQMVKHLNRLLKLPDSMAQTIFVFLSGALYSSFMFQEDKTRHTVFVTFREMVHAYMQINN